MPQACTAQDLRDRLASVPGLVLPDTLTDGMLQAYIQEQTAVVLTLRGRDALPAAGLELDLVVGAVKDLACLQVRRYLRPDDGDYLTALRKDRELILDTLKPVERQGVPQRFLELIDT